MDILHDIAFALWFMLPAAYANVAPIFFARFPAVKAWDTPLDFGKIFQGRPIFGPHKTWRGLISGILIATIFLWLEQLIAAHASWAKNFTAGIDYPALPTLILGPLFGLGALGGDAVESFFKRRHGTKSGKSWFPFDQLDYIVGALIVSLFFVVLSMRQYIFIVIIWFGLHLAGTYVGWRLGLKDQPI